MTADINQTIRRILKVNHAGEYGAIRIYRAQLWVSKHLHKDLTSFLETTLSHEEDHCQKFFAAMPPRGARPCRAMSLWGVGGYVLGCVTAIMGRNAILVCTEAVEATVHRHLEAQIHFLKDKDEALMVMIAEIQVQEIEHLDHARRYVRPSPFNAVLSHSIGLATELVIWLSTQGDVTRMEKALQRDA